VIKGFAECMISDPETRPEITQPPPTAPPGANQGAVATADAGTIVSGRAEAAHLKNYGLLQHIMDSCDHIQRILDNSLDLSKLEQHKLVLANEVVDIQAIGSQIYSMLSMRTSPGVRLEVDCPNIKFRGDITRWTQLLLNLLQNSLKFTTGGFVRLNISAGVPSDGGRKQLHVKVADTGRGIAPSGQAALFQKYQQVWPTLPTCSPPVSIRCSLARSPPVSLGRCTTERRGPTRWRARERGWGSSSARCARPSQFAHYEGPILTDNVFCSSLVFSTSSS